MIITNLFVQPTLLVRDLSAGPDHQLLVSVRIQAALVSPYLILFGQGEVLEKQSKRSECDIYVCNEPLVLY